MKRNLLVITGIIIIIVVGAGFWVCFRIQKQPPADQAGELSPKTYSEVFAPPIDVNESPEQHKAAYQNSAEKVMFPEKDLVRYPLVIPSGYKLYEVRGTESNDFTFVYKNASGQTIQIFEGVGEIGEASGIGTVETKAGQGWLWQAGNKIGLTLMLSATSGAEIYIIGTGGVLKEDLIAVADSLFKIYP